MKILLVTIFVFASFLNLLFAQNASITSINIYESKSHNISSIFGKATYNQFSDSVWRIVGCEEDYLEITMSEYGNYALKNTEGSVTLNVWGYDTEYTQNSKTFYVSIKEIIKNNNFWCSVIDVSNLSIISDINLSPIKKYSLNKLEWVRSSFTNINICERLPFPLPSYANLYAIDNNNFSTLVGTCNIDTVGYFYKVNNKYLKRVDLSALKNGDSLRLCRLKNANNTCIQCINEVFDTLFSQKVTVTKIKNIGTLKIIVSGNTQICPGDSVKLTGGYFFSACAETFYKDNKKFPTTYFNYHTGVSIVTEPGAYFLANSNDFDQYMCLNNNCLQTSNDVVITQGLNCKSFRLFGTVFEDKNFNNNLDLEEITFSNVKIKITDLIADTVLGFCFSNENGQYDFMLDVRPVNGYKISIENKEYFNTTFTNNAVSAFKKTNLATYLLTSNDLSVSLSSGRNRPGFDVPVYINVTSSGKFGNKGKVELELDNIYSYVSSTLLPQSISGNKITWELDTVLPGKFRQITLNLKLSATATIGSTTLLTAKITPGIEDFIKQNNVANLNSLVSGSFDPNEKELIAGNRLNPASVSDTSTLFYTIRFQNKGNDTAFTVVLIDKISPFLDFDTFEMLDASHPYSLKFNEDTLSWTFTSILLQDDKINEPASHGHVHYKIKPKPKAPVGSKINNKAEIYFDFNSPVITNTIITTVAKPIITYFTDSETLSSGLKVFPNPSKGTIHILSNHTGQFEISDMSGKLFYKQFIDSNNQQIDISNLKSGAYLYRFVMDDGVKYGKIVKE